MTKSFTLVHFYAMDLIKCMNKHAHNQHITKHHEKRRVIPINGYTASKHGCHKLFSAVVIFFIVATHPFPGSIDPSDKRVLPRDKCISIAVMN